MRTFEILSSALVLISFVIGSVLEARRLISWLLNSLLILVLVIQIGYEGPHWQIFPLYVAAFLAVFFTLLRKRWPNWARIAAAIVGCALVGASVFLSWLMPMFQLPKPSGQYMVGTRIMHLVDASRVEEEGFSPSGKRELMVQAWYPAVHPSFWNGHLAAYQRRKEVTLRASYRSVLKTNSYLDALVQPGGPYPVLIYNPSWMGERTEGTFQMEELASHGFVVIGVDHTFYGGFVEFPDGRVTDSHTAPQLGNFDHATAEEEWRLGGKYVRIEAQDDIFVLNQLEGMNRDPGSPWYHSLDLSRVGAMGFSIGGAAAEQMAFQDSRVKAALNLDGWTFGDAGPQGLNKPLMVIFEDKHRAIPSDAELHSQSLPERTYAEFSAEDFAHVTGGMRKYGGFLLFLNGTRHVDFTDRSLLSPLHSLTGRGTLDPTRAHAIMNAYTLAFFLHFLKGENEPLLDANPSPFAEMEYQHFVVSQP